MHSISGRILPATKEAKSTRLKQHIVYLGCFLTFPVALFLMAQNRTGEPPHRWVETSYLDFADGTPVDAGANTYISADGSIRLINQWDLNGDGYVDIVLPTDDDNNIAVSSYIYWGGKKFDVNQKTHLPGNGARGGAIADLNKDGIPELVVANEFNGTKTELRSFIYWGSREGYSAQNRAELPTVAARAVAAGDLNNDGYPELVFASSGYSYQFTKVGGDFAFLRPVSDIYWGSPQGYSPKNTSQLPTFYARDVKIADVNKDGYPDIIFAMAGQDGQNSGVFIYWGSKQARYSESNRAFLPGIGASAVAVADLNRDGFPEILLANEGKSAMEFAGGVEYPLPSYIYWGGAEGHSPARRTELPAAGARDVKVGDLNRDGFADIVYANQVGEASFIYWGDSGMAGGYAPQRRTALPTLNASRCAIHDLNQDGLPDLIFSNEHDAKTYNVNSYVYWNSKSGFESSRRSNLPTLGATDVVVSDMDNDGKADLFFVNNRDGTAGQLVDTYVYWGSPQTVYSPSARSTLPANAATAYSAADLNNDGYVDLILTGKELRIFWGSQGGYSRGKSTTLPVRLAAFNTSVADFNRDGYLDVSVSDWAGSPSQDRVVVYWGGPRGFSAANRWSAPFGGARCHVIADLDGNGYLDIVQTGTENQATVFWNGPGGFSTDRKTVLPSKMAVVAEVADLNADGYLDLLICNFYDVDKLKLPEAPPDISAPPQTATFAADTYIYWGSPDGFSANRRLILPTVGSSDAAVADLNRDGYLDLVLSSYHAGITRNHPSYIFWGSANGLDAANVTMLPTESASAVLIADFNTDGSKDILFANHTDGTNHRTNSFLYWGGKDGFSTKQRLSLPSIGVHGMSRVDIGNIKDRTDEFDYISSPFDAGEKARFRTISWEAATSLKPGVKFQVRFASTREALAQAPWVGPGGPGTFYVNSGSRFNAPSGSHWIQYKATLISSGGTRSPVLKSVTVEYGQPIPGPN